MKRLKKVGWIAGIVLLLAGISGCGGGGGDDLPNSSASTSIKSTQSLWSFDIQTRQFTLDALLSNSVEAKVTLDQFRFELGGCQIESGTLRFNGASDTALVFRTKGQTLGLKIEGRVVDSGCTPTSKILTYRETVEKDGQTRVGTFSLDLSSGSSGESTASGYTFYNVMTPVHVTQPNASYELKAQLLKNGFAAPGEEVLLKPFDAGYGTVASSSVTTDQNGYAKFVYTSPATLPPEGTTTFVTMVYADENSSTVEANIQLIFGAGATAIAEFNLTNVSTPLVVRTPGELLQISAVVVDKNNVPAAGHKVSITAISDLKYGTIVSDATVVSDGSGHVAFTYKAPESLGDLEGNTTTVTLLLQEDSYTVSKEVTIRFEATMTDTPAPLIVIPQDIREINLTSNGQPVEMNIQVFEEGTHNPFTTGTVKVKLPSKVLDGVDVGKFDAYEVEVGNDGVATFHYTGPQNLQSLIDQGDTFSVFSFYHVDNPTEYGDVRVNYDPQDDYVPVNYTLETSSSDGNYTMGLDRTKTFIVMLKDDQGNAVESDQLLEIKISTKNFSVGKLIDPDTNSETATLTFSGDDAANNKAFTLATGKISGLVPVEISVRFRDANGEEQQLSMVMNVTVFSGPPTAISISYVGTREDKENAKFIEIFNVTVTDAYNNLVNTKPFIATGAMVEYAVDGSSSTDDRSALPPRLWHGFNGDTLGTLKKVGSDGASFVSDVADTFRYVDLYNDKLVVFGRGYVYEALGKWDIENVSGTNDILELVDNYFGETREGLGFAVGHNNRQDLCSADGTEYLGNMRSPKYQVDSNGHVMVELEYDHHLTGKDVMIWVNLTGYQADDQQMNRIGEAKKHTLRGMGLKSDDSCTLAPGTTRICGFTIWHETIPEQYRNGHFGARTTGKCQVLNVVDWSNFHDARDCRNSVAFIELNVTNPGTEDCVIGLDGIAVSAEFQSSNSW